MSRVEDLEVRVAELSAELDGLLDEYMDARRRLHELEASHDPDVVEPDPYSLGDDPHAVVVDRSRTDTDADPSRSGTSTPTPERDEPATAGPNDYGASDEASQEEVDQAVRRVEGDGEDADAGDDDSDETPGEPEKPADDIIVG